MILFIRGLKNPQIYSNRQGLKIGCLLLMIDNILISSELVLKRQNLIYTIFISSFDLAMLVWFAIICYKWEIDDRRKNLIEIGVPYHN